MEVICGSANNRGLLINTKGSKSAQHSTLSNENDSEMEMSGEEGFES